MPPEVKITPTSTWIPLATTIAVCSMVFTIAWWAATLQADVKAQGKRLEDFSTQTNNHFAYIEALLTPITKETGSKEDVPDTAAAKPSPPAPAPPVITAYRPSWYYSVPAGWTIGPDGKLRKL